MSNKYFYSNFCNAIRHCYSSMLLGRRRCTNTLIIYFLDIFYSNSQMCHKHACMLTNIQILVGPNSLNGIILGELQPCPMVILAENDKCDLIFLVGRCYVMAGMLACRVGGHVFKSVQPRKSVKINLGCQVNPGFKKRVPRNVLRSKGGFILFF